MPPTHCIIQNQLIRPIILNESDDVITINDNNVQFLIGLGVKKGGSTSFNSLYISFTEYLNNNTDSSSYYYPFAGHVGMKRKETHYWESCLLTASIPIFKKINDYFHIIRSHQIQNKKCDFNEYLELKFEPVLNFKDESKQLIISEKTPDYFGYYHSSYFLSYYSYKYRIKFYILLRNPIYRTWSSYYLYNALHAKSKININDTDKMQQIIANDINDFEKYYEDYSTLLKYIELNDYNGTRKYNEYVVKYYVKGIYNIWSRVHNKMNSILMMSCYFPILLMWKQIIEVQIINDWNFQTRIKLEDNLKIIQSELYFNNPLETVLELIKWVNDNNTNNINLNKLYSSYNGKQSSKKIINARAPRTVDIQTLDIYDKLDSFYRSCNRNLYTFIEKHPNLMLNQMPFQRWD